MAVSAAGRSHGGSLGPWVVSPLVWLGLIFASFMYLPSGDCAGEVDLSLTNAVLTTLTVAATLTTVLAGVWFWVRVLARRGRSRPWIQPALAVAALLLAFFLLVEVELSLSAFWVLLLTGMLLTGVLLIVLVLSWLRQARVEEAGLMLPFYLIGAGFFCCLPLGLLALALAHGIGC